MIDEFMTKLRTLGEEGSDLRETGNTAALMIDRFMGTIGNVGQWGEIKNRNRCVEILKDEISRGGNLESALARIEAILILPEAQARQ